MTEPVLPVVNTKASPNLVLGLVIVTLALVVLTELRARRAVAELSTRLAMIETAMRGSPNGQPAEQSKAEVHIPKVAEPPPGAVVQKHEAE